MNRPADPKTDVVTELPPRGVFLSYSHRDSTTAVKLKEGLERLGVAVRLDSDAMQPGCGIQQFIRESIRTTVATVWLVSEASLVSDWVGIEIVNSLNDVELWGKRRLMACYLDEGFLDRNFRLRATATIDARLGDIEQSTRQYAENKIDTNDLAPEKSRLYQLRSNLGKLLEFLKESLCVDVREAQLDASLQRLANNLRPIAPGKNTAPLAVASDIERRVQEIYDLFDNVDGDRAMKRLMDFVRDFSADKQCLRRAVVLNSNYRVLGNGSSGAKLDEFFDARTKILSQALELLDGIVDALTQKVAS